MQGAFRIPAPILARHGRSLRLPVVALGALGLWLLMGESLRLLALPPADFWMTQLTVGVVLAGLAAGWAMQAVALWQSLLRMAVVWLMLAQVHLLLSNLLTV